MSAIPKMKVVRTDYKPVPLLRVLTGGLTPNNTDQNVHYFWLFCYAALWNHSLFTPKEIRRFELLIRAHFENGPNAELTFRQLVERVCLAKRYLSHNKSHHLAKPEDWLNIHYASGLSGTRQWHQAMQNQRKTVPHYNEGIRILSNAIFKSCYHFKASDLEYYRKKFIRSREYDLLHVYMNTLVHLQLH